GHIALVEQVCHIETDLPALQGRLIAPQVVIQAQVEQGRAGHAERVGRIAPGFAQIAHARAHAQPRQRPALQLVAHPRRRLVLGTATGCEPLRLMPAALGLSLEYTLCSQLYDAITLSPSMGSLLASSSRPRVRTSPAWTLQRPPPQICVGSGSVVVRFLRRRSNTAAVSSVRDPGGSYFTPSSY